MTERTRLAASIACVLLAGAATPRFVPGLRSQAPPLPSRIVPEGGVQEPGITVEPYDATRHATFTDLFQRPDWTRTGQYALVISNGSSHAIDSLVLRWALADRAQGVRWRTFQTDRYWSRSRGAVIEAGHSAIVTPSGIVADSMVTKTFLTSALLAPQLLETLAAQPVVRVHVDSAILDDGRVLGSDGFEVVDYLQARHRAARLLADEIRSTAGTADDVGAVLARHTASEPVAGDTTGQWLFRLAGEATRSPGSLASILAVPDLPRFSR